MQQLHPLRLQYEIFSDANPLMAPIAAAAEMVRSNRQAVKSDNPFLALQENMSRHVVAGLNAWRDMSETMAERAFVSMYGAPTLQAAMGIDREAKRPARKAGKSPLHRQLLERRTAELRSQIATGGLRECVVRAALYVGMARGSVDERSFELIRRIRLAPGEIPRLTLAEFKTLVREQFFMLLIDEEVALAAIPSLLPSSSEERRKALSVLRHVVSARGELTGVAAERMDRISKLFEDQRPQGGRPRLQAGTASRNDDQIKAS
jgi:hypothetical protein